MAKKRKGKKPTEEVFGSDDERTYAKEPVPDKDDNDYYEDEVDRFHADRDKILLDKGAKIQGDLPSSDEEEVLAFADDDSDDDDEEIAEYESRLQKFKSMGFKDEMASDIEEEDEDEEEDEKAWGGKKNRYYGDDLDDYDEVESGGSDTEAAILEEKEAREIQKRMADQLEDEDFDLELFKTAKKPKDSKEEDIEAEKVLIPKDLSKLSKRDKLKLLEKDSPELPELMEDYKTKLGELHSKWLPIFRVIQAGKLPDSNAVAYINAKVRLSLNYCTNLSFYLMLKAKRTAVTHHPVIARIVQYRNLLKELSSADARIEDEVNDLLEKINAGQTEFEPQTEIEETVTVKTSKSMQKKREKIRKAKVRGSDKKKLSEMMEESEEKEEEEEEEEEEEDVMTEGNPEGGRTWGRKRKQGDGETKGEKAALEYYDMMKRRKKTDGEEEENEDEQMEQEGDEQEAVEGEYANEEGEEEEGGKRGITYQMEKNKGLMPKRKKEQRNPRVKHRMKFRKAKIRRRGQVRDVRTEMTRYGGEISGIRAGIKRSVKLK